MAKGKGRIGLTVAERRKPTKESFDFRHTSVEHWVKALPLGNIGETARLVYSALHEVNRLDIPWKDRQRFLEQLREPVIYIQRSLTKRYTGMAFPLPAKIQRIATLSQTLYLEMALGYKTAIEDIQGSSLLTRDNKALTEIIHRAVRYLSEAILTAYRTYAPHPSNSWFELHLLFLHSEYKNLHQTPVHDRFNEALPESSIARAYKQIVLLALASPYRLRQGEAEEIYQALARWAGHAEILPYNTPEASEALFVVHLDSDHAPDYQAFNHRDCSNELCRLVDTRQLSHILLEELKYQIAERKRGAITPALMQLLIRSWGVGPRRSYSRNESDAMVEVVVGGSTLHQALAHQLGDESQYGKRAAFTSRSVIGAGKGSGDDIWDILASEKVRRGYQEFDKQQHAQELTELPLTIQNWQIRNESAGGYRLVLDGNQQAKVLVGELLGLRHPQNSGFWEVGAVRWIRQDSEGNMEIGVQVLAPEALPVSVRNVHGEGRATENQYALLLPAIPTINQPASLITPTLLFTPHSEVHLHMPNREMDINLMEKMQDSGSFIQFRFSTKSEVTQKGNKKESKNRKPDSGFGTVWHEL